MFVLNRSRITTRRVDEHLRRGLKTRSNVRAHRNSVEQVIIDY